MLAFSPEPSPLPEGHRTAQAPNMEQVLAGVAAIGAIRAVELVPVHNRYVLFPALDLFGTLVS